MKKILKYGLLAFVGVLIILAAGAAYLLATFDPNAYKPQIVEAVKNRTQRTLKLEGDIKLKLFPRIGASFGKASLSEFRSDQEFASIDDAQVSVALLPLLSRQIIVDKVSVSGVKVNLVKHKDGKLNIDDLLSQAAPPGAETKPAAPPAKAPVLFDIAAVDVDHGDLSYQDEVAGARYAVKDLNLTTGRIANGVPTTVDLSATLQSSKPKADIAAQLKSGLVFDLQQNAYRLDGLELQARGSALDITNLALKANGDANANLATGEFGASKFVLSASGTQAGNNFSARLDAPSIALTKDSFSGNTLTLNAKLDGSIGKLTADVTVPGVEGNRHAFKIRAVTVDADLTQPTQRLKIKLATPVSGNIETQQFNLSDMRLNIDATGEKLPNKSVSSEMKGSLKLDLKKQNIAADVAGGLLQSKVKASVAVNGFTNPAIRFNADVDQFDADPYLPAKSKGGAPGKPSASAEPEQPFDLSALKPLDLDGSLRVGALKAMNIRASQVRMDVKARRGVVNINPISANLYKGSVKGSATVNAAQALPSFAVNAAMSGVDVGPLAKDAVDLDLVEGTGNVTVNLTTQGDRVSALKKRLNGTAAVNLGNGAIKGINLAKLVQSVESLGKGANVQAIQTLGVNKDEKTTFSEFRASFRVRDGVAHNDDLSVRSAVLRVTGNGDIDIGNDSLNYDAKAAFSKTEQGRAITLPVNVSGTFDNMKFKVDYGALLTDLARQKVQEKTEELKSKAIEEGKQKLREQLKGLFK